MGVVIPGYWRWYVWWFDWWRWQFGWN